MRDVKKGCLSCIHKEVSTKKEPCKSCKDWSAWEDNSPPPAGKEKKA